MQKYFKLPLRVIDDIVRIVEMHLDPFEQKDVLYTTGLCYAIGGVSNPNLVRDRSFTLQTQDSGNVGAHTPYQKPLINYEDTASVRAHKTTDPSGNKGKRVDILAE